MPQAPALGAGQTRAVDSLSANNEKTLADNQTIRQDNTGAVYLMTTRPSGSIVERRVDSPGDLDHVAKGGAVWWKSLMSQQEARGRANAAASKKSTKKVTSDE